MKWTYRKGDDEEKRNNAWKEAKKRGNEGRKKTDVILTNCSPVAVVI
jgi:hypothetical protein